MWPPLPDRPAHERAYAPVPTNDLPLRKAVAKVVANPEVEARFATSGKSENDDDLFDDFDGGKSTGITTIGKGWRLEENSNGRLRWRWQVKDGAGNPVTYIKSDGTLGYKRGSQYVGNTQRTKAESHDLKRRRKRRSKPGGRGKNSR